MNRVVVSQAAAGLAALPARPTGTPAAAVIVGYDARYNSDVFARDTAEILAGAGLRAAAAPRRRCRRRWSPSASGTSAASPASWSPRPTTRRRTTATRSTSATARRSSRRPTPRSRPRSPRSPPRRWPTSPAATTTALVGDELVDAYVARAASLVPPDAPARPALGLHRDARRRAPRSSTRVVGRGRLPRAAPWSPSRPSPTRPSRPSPFPNPEEPGAIDLALALAREAGRRRGDRQRPGRRPLRRSPPSIGGDWRMLTGDELGALLGRRRPAPRRDRAPTPARWSPARCSATMAAAHGQPFATTLTGFKWIGRVPGPGLRLRGGDRLLHRPGRRARQGRHHRRWCACSRWSPRLKARGPDDRRPAGRDRAHLRRCTSPSQLSFRVVDLTLIARRDGPAAGRPAVRRWPARP